VTRRSARLPRLRAQAPGRDERGSISLELVVVFPAILLVLFFGVQVALYYYARNIALAAAQEGLRTARAENGTAAQGQLRAYEFISSANSGGGVLTGVSVNPSRTTTEASITVTGNALEVIPFLPMPKVTQTAVGPVERFTTGP
jgi:Flp pilus assembly protein TadG